MKYLLPALFATTIVACVFSNNVSAEERGLGTYLGLVGGGAVIYKFNDGERACYVALRNSFTMQNSPAIWCAQ